MKTVVFDFDKTLTYKDSLTQFFYERMRGWRMVMFPFYVVLKVLSKFSVISVKKEKELAMTALLPKDKDVISDLFKIFVKHIRLCPVNKNVEVALKDADRVIILSASPEDYLKILYPRCEVIGLRYEILKGVKITQHPFGDEKLRLLKEKGIDTVDEFYYDSRSDEAVFPICKKVNRIKNGVIVEERNLI